jgi:hypothetical protein
VCTRARYSSPPAVRSPDHPWSEPQSRPQLRPRRASHYVHSSSYKNYALENVTRVPSPSWHRLLAAGVVFSLT